MASKERILAVATTCVAVALSTAAAAKSPRKVKLNEAMAFENAIIARDSGQSLPNMPEKVYTQPANKTEPCKLPTTSDQLGRKNFRAYWDGDCKDGHAYGLGRDIAISDTHHAEEITVHDHLAPGKERSIAFYDFVNGYVHYKSVIDSSGESFGLEQQFRLAPDGSLSLQQVLGESSRGSMLAMQSSPFSVGTMIMNVRQGQPAYRFQDFSAAPATSDQVAGVVTIGDPSTKTFGGFGIVRLRNGAVLHRQVGADGLPSGDLVKLPQEYVDHLLEKLAAPQVAIKKANIAVQRAQQMEREYLYMACNNSYTMERVPAKDTAATQKICKWQEQWKEPYAKAQANFQQQLEQARQQVAVREQQLAQNFALQQQLAAQHAAANAISSAAASSSLQQTVNGLMQQNQQNIQQLQNLNNQMLNSNTNTQSVTCVTLSNGTVRCK